MARAGVRVHCPKHGVDGSLQVKVYCLHWSPPDKTAKMCLINVEHLPPAAQKILADLRLSLK